MKKFILLLLVPVFIVSCANNTQTPSNTSSSHTPSAMDDMPCHKMPDGSLMGDCPVDEFGNPYIPKEGGAEHDDTGTDAHLHDDDHEHADDVPPHRH